jgi:predicted Zn-dependent protease
MLWLMKKLFFLVLFLTLVFGGCYYVYSKINWTKILGIEKVTTELDQQIGDVFWKSYSADMVEVKDEKVVMPILQMVDQLCSANGIKSSSIKVHVVNNKEINAFAMPGRHLVVHTGLIEFATNQQEIAGVVAHEIAHLESGHVMKKLGKEIGLSVILNLTLGDIGGEVVRNALTTITSTAYDRSLEKDADLKAVDYMLNAKMDPKMLSSFLGKLGEQSQTPEVLQWVNTHPDSKERVRYINEKISLYEKSTSN